MTIALFSDSYLPTKSGIVTVVVQLREQLIALGHRVILVTVETTDEYATDDPDIYRVHSVPLGLGTDQFLGIPAILISSIVIPNSALQKQVLGQRAF